jgi:hypothetical protein
MYILIIIVVVLAICGVALVIGPTGSLKDATDKIKPQDKSKMDQKDLFAEVTKIIKKAFPKDRKFGELKEVERERIRDKAWRMVVDRGLDKEIKRKDVDRIEVQVWREGLADEKELPSDDPAERWKKMAGKKYETLRRIDLKDESGFLNCPQVDVYEDAGKATTAGQMNHDEWVVVLEESGDMTKVKRRRDQKEAWIESKWVKRIYTQEDIEKGPKIKKSSEREE